MIVKKRVRATSVPLPESTYITAIENKLLKVSNLVKKTDYEQKSEKFKGNLLIMIMINILLLQNSTS